VRTIFFGTGAFGLPILDALKNSPHKILAVVTTPDKPRGRHLETGPSPVKEWAIQNKLPLFQFIKTNPGETVRDLKELAADIFVVVDFGLILSKQVLDLPRLVPLNVHPSLLPRYRGAAPMQWALINGDAETGVSIVKVTEKLDAGGLLVQKKTAILPGDDIFTLEERLGRQGAEALLQGIEKLEGGDHSFVPQDETRASYARKLTKEDGRIRWSAPAAEIRNRVRAMKIWPGSYSFYEGRRILIDRVEHAAMKKNPGIRPGAIYAASRRDGLFVAAGDGMLEIKSLQLEGKKLMDAKDFLNGFPIKEGSFFE
jgi:methionyl-tRNA formyltransferase